MISISSKLKLTSVTRRFALKLSEQLVSLVFVFMWGIQTLLRKQSALFYRFDDWRQILFQIEIGIQIMWPISMWCPSSSYLQTLIKKWSIFLPLVRKLKLSSSRDWLYVQCICHRCGRLETFLMQWTHHWPHLRWNFPTNYLLVDSPEEKKSKRPTSLKVSFHVAALKSDKIQNPPKPLSILSQERKSVLIEGDLLV